MIDYNDPDEDEMEEILLEEIADLMQPMVDIKVWHEL